MLLNQGIQLLFHEGEKRSMKTIRKLNWFGSFCFTLFLIGIPIPGHADLGDLLAKFQPYAIVQEDYSNNINLTRENKIHDFITSVFAGLRFSTSPRPTVPVAPITEENSGINLDYRLGYFFYAEKTTYNYLSHDGALNAWYTFDRRLTFRTREYLIQSEEPRERDYTLGAIEGQYLLGTDRGRPIYFRNVFEPSIEYRFGEEDLVSLNYRNNIYRNQSHLYENSREDCINPRFDYWFDIRNGVHLDYSLTFGDFERSPDLTGHSVVGRYTFRFNPRTSVFGEYTYLKRDFGAPTVTGFESIDYDVHSPRFGIEHALSPSLSVIARLGYFWEIPTRGPSANGLSYDINLTKHGEETTYILSFQGGYSEDYFTAENLGLTRTYRALGTVTHQLAERVLIGFSSSFDWFKDRERRIDRIWQVDGNASYKIFNWLVLSVVPSYRQNHSNISERDYKEYRGMFRMTTTF